MVSVSKVFQKINRLKINDDIISEHILNESKKLLTYILIPRFLFKLFQLQFFDLEENFKTESQNKIAMVGFLSKVIYLNKINL